MKCPSCNADDIKGLYCSNCGAKLPQEQEINSLNSGLENLSGQESKSINSTNGQNAFGDALNQFTESKRKEIGIGRHTILIFFGIIGVMIFVVYSCASSQEIKDKSLNYQKALQLIQEKKWDDAAIVLVNQDQNLYNYCQTRLNYDQGNYSMSLSYLSEIPDSYNGTLSEEIKKFRDDFKKNKPQIALDMIKSQRFYDAALFTLNDESLKPFYNLASALDKLNQGDLEMARSYVKDIEGYNGYASAEVTSYVKTILDSTADSKIKQYKKSQGVHIGMTEQEVLDSNWGKPNHINKTTTSYGVHEQWVYNGGYLYFDNGILTSIQN